MLLCNFDTNMNSGMYLVVFDCYNKLGKLNELKSAYNCIVSVTKFETSLWFVCW